MKKLLAVLVIAGMLVGAGCAINKFLCKPTPEQQNAAAMGLSVAQTLLDAGATVIGGTVATAIAQNAIPTFQRVVDGWCATQAEWDAATASVEAGAKKMPGIYRAFGNVLVKEQLIPVEQAIATLKQIRWDR